MDGIFTLPYSEFEIVNQFQKYFKRKDGYSVYIPVSRQEKSVDFILTKSRANKVARFQVKSSRTYIHEAKISRGGSIKHPEFMYNLWFNNFKEKYEPESADFYLLFGLFPIYNTENPINSNFWKSIILCMPDNKMKETLSNVLTKKEQKPDRFFSISFNTPDKITGTRGFLNSPDFSTYLFQNKISDIKDFF